MADGLVRAVGADGTVRALAAVTTDLVDEARRRHGTAPTATAALGRALTGALLLGATIKRDERLGLEISADGPLRGLLADATPAGDVRGFVYEPRAHPPPRGGKLDVGGAVGRGTLCVTRVPLAGGSLYRSVVPLVSGEIAEDLASYLVGSEQVPSALALGVFVEPDGRVGGAGGYLLQTLPGATLAMGELLVRAVARAPQASELVRSGLEPAAMLSLLLAAVPHAVIGEQDVRFRCRCSPARVARAVVAMGRAEIQDILAKERRVDAQCEFCAERYHLDERALRDLLAELTNGS
jgi:molecular chaperone Hsp33